MRRFFRCLSVTFFIILLESNLPNLFAQTRGEPPKSQTLTAVEVKPSGYPVVLGDQVLFFIKEVQGLSAQDRAKTTSDRLHEIAEDPRIPIGSISISDYRDPLTLLSAGNRSLLAVLDQDAKAEGKTRQELAAEYRQKLNAAIGKYREERSLKRKLTGLFYALITSLILIAVLYLLSKIYHQGEAKIQAWLSSKKVRIGIQSFEVIRAERINVVLTFGLKILRLFILLWILYLYFNLLLTFFPRTKVLGNKLFDYFLGLLLTIGSVVWKMVPGLAVVVVIIFITLYVLKLMRLFFDEVEKETIVFKGFYPEWAKPTQKIFRLLIVAFAAVVAFPYIPASDTPAFKGISIFFGILFSLGSTSAIANIVAGYTLTYRRVFKLGDRVKIADFTGDVVETGLQVTHLRTIKNEEIVVPNSIIVNSHVINYSSLARDTGLILHTSVTIGYDAPWRQVQALLLMAAEKTPGLLREPPPFVLQTSLDDFYVSYELNVYTDRPLEMITLYSDLHKNIQDAFNEYGVQIMSPHYVVDPKNQKVVLKEQWYAPPAKPPDGSGKES
jgi:small-conductance mechanosensitive channel